MRRKIGDEEVVSAEVADVDREGEAETLIMSLAAGDRTVRLNVATRINAALCYPEHRTYGGAVNAPDC